MKKIEKDTHWGINTVLFLLLMAYFYYMAFSYGWKGYESVEKIILGTLMLTMALGYKKIILQKVVALIFAIVFLLSFWIK